VGPIVKISGKISAMLGEDDAADSVGMWGFACHKCRENNPFIDKPGVTICEIESPVDTPETRTYRCRFCHASNEVTMGKTRWRRLDELMKKHGVRS
jgi:hypothetical protein